MKQMILGRIHLVEFDEFLNQVGLIMKSVFNYNFLPIDLFIMGDLVGKSPESFYTRIKFLVRRQLSPGIFSPGNDG